MESKERATLATNEALRLRPQTVFSNILEGHKTFGDLAPQYGLTVEEFEHLVFEKVGPKEFKRLKKASDTYEGYRKRTHKPKEVILIPAEQSDQTTAPAESEFSGTFKPNSEEEKDMEEKIMVLGKQRDNAMREIKALTAKIEAKVALVNAEDKVKKALEEVDAVEKRLKQAKANLAKAKKEQKDAEAELNDSKDSLEKWQECLQNIENQIAELEHQVVYLVAPGYHGEMPKYGTLVSSVEIPDVPGVTIEETNGVELVSPLSAEDMFLFDTMQEAKQAYKYLRLVIKYALSDKEYHLLVDSEEIKILLRKQEVIES